MIPEVQIIKNFFKGSNTYERIWVITKKAIPVCHPSPLDWYYLAIWDGFRGEQARRKTHLSYSLRLFEF